MTKNLHHYIGIDLGTTNSCIHYGVINPATNRVDPRVVQVDQLTNSGARQNRELLPSYIWFYPGKPFPYVGEYAKEGLKTQPSRVAHNIKNYMGIKDWRFEVDGQQYSAQDLAAQLLQMMSAGIRNRWQYTVDDVIVTVPASFDPDQREDTLAAVRRAGFKTIDENGQSRNLLLDEPKAALYDLLNQQLAGQLPQGVGIDLSIPRTVLVFDLGGGTLDVSLHKVSNSSNEIEVDIQDLAISRYTQLGGFVFDNLVADELQRRFEQRHKIKLENLPENARNAVRVRLEFEAEVLKRRMTDDIQMFLDNEKDVPDDYKVDVELQYIHDNLSLNTQVSKAEYGSLIEPLLAPKLTIADIDRTYDKDADRDNIITPVLDVLKKAKQHQGSLPKIDYVVLSGGMTRVHAIRERIKDLLGIRPITVLDPDKTVSRGASIYHYWLHRGWRPSQILAESIGVEITGRKIYHIIRSGSSLPFNATFTNQFHIPEIGANMLTIPLYRGEVDTPDLPNVKILERTFTFDQSYPGGTPIKVDVSVDQNKILHFVAEMPDGTKAEVDTGTDSQTVIMPETTDKKDVSEKPTYMPPGPPLDLVKFKREFQQYDADKDEQSLKALAMNAIKAANAPELAAILLDLYNNYTLGGYGKGRAMWFFGEFAVRYPNDPIMDRIINACIHCIQSTFKSHLSVLVNNVSRHAIHALGKIGSPVAESHLLGILNDPKGQPIRGDILVALGKCSESYNAIKQIRAFFDSANNQDRIGSLWAVGRLGTREKTPRLPIGNLYSIIDEIGRHTSKQNEEHATVRRYAVYALGEIGDRRTSLGHKDVVNENYQKKILGILEQVQLETRHDIKMHPNDETQQMANFLPIAIKQVQGEELSVQESRILMSLRVLMSTSNHN